MRRASLLLVFLFGLLIHITGFAADQRHLYRLPPAMKCSGRATVLE